MPDESSEIPVAPPPSVETALAAAREFLRLAIDLADGAAARTLMTASCANVPAFDPRGLAGKEYAMGEPFVDDDAVIVPVAFRDNAGLQANFPLVVVMENGFARIDVESGVELMMDGEIHFVDPDEPQ
jgi:hypothetical protein